jgi:hypothetical protein
MKRDIVCAPDVVVPQEPHRAIYVLGQVPELSNSDQAR